MFKAWLFGICRNKCLRYFQKQKSDGYKTDNSQHIDSAPFAKVHDYQDLILKIFNKMDLGEVEVLILVNVKGLTYEELGQLLNLSPESLTVKVSRAKKKFIEHYNELGEELTGFMKIPISDGEDDNAA